MDASLWLGQGGARKGAGVAGNGEGGEREFLLKRGQEEKMEEKERIWGKGTRNEGGGGHIRVTVEWP